jgi:hypothetical protein
MRQYRGVTDLGFLVTAEDLVAHFDRQQGGRDECSDGRRAAASWLYYLTGVQSPARLAECDPLVAAGSNYTHARLLRT